VTSAPLWSPDPRAAAESALARFRAAAARESHQPIEDYAALQRWALAEPEAFWRLWLQRSRLSFEGSPDVVLEGSGVEAARFFPGLRMSYAENLLTSEGLPEAQRPALIGRDEQGGRSVRRRDELLAEVRNLAGALQALGLGPGDAVACISGNRPEAVIACLAATAIGAVWSSLAPDLGFEATLERLSQLQPKLLFAGSTHRHHGAEKDQRPRLQTLVQALPNLRGLVALRGALALTGVALPEYEFASLVASGPPLARFPRLPFDHPLFVLFSSGTTGRPKGIVHGIGGTLLEHSKEHALHSGFGAADTLYFHTTCGWMMWNWQLSALAQGTTLVLYDGSVSFPESEALLQMLLEEQVTVFGTSPAYLQYLAQADIVPRELGDWSRLRAIQSTGSVLFPAQFEWVQRQWRNLPVQSISGGTDILGCFVLGNPELPVHAGESQCVSLGLDVRAFADGAARSTGAGELVCCNPFPSRPVGFLSDPDGRRYHEAYFAEHPGLWTHGDFVELLPHGGARVLGRSDGTLNVKGVRIGPAEIYAILQGFPEIQDCMALEQRAERELGGSRLVLLLVLAPGQDLVRPLVLRLKKALHDHGSINHVPAVVARVSGLPVTFSGKKSERAATDALHGRPVANRSALRNPETLDEIAAHPDLKLA